MTIIIFWLILGPIVGGMIGQTRNCPIAGVMLGLILGPIGWLLTLLYECRQLCPECKGPTPNGAKRCLHCGVIFAAPVGSNTHNPSSRDLAKLKSWERTVGGDDEVAKWAKQNGEEPK